MKEIRVIFREHNDGDYSAEVMGGDERIYRVRASKDAFVGLPYDRSKPNIFNDIADEIGTTIANQFFEFVER